MIFKEADIMVMQNGEKIQLNLSLCCYSLIYDKLKYIYYHTDF